MNENKQEKPPKPFGKLVCVGPEGSGKTALLRCFLDFSLLSEHKQTIGVDFLTKDFGKKYSNLSLSLQLWDTPGRDKPEDVGSSFLRGADVWLLTLDLTVFDAIDRTKSYLPLVRENMRSGFNRHPLVYVVGTKSDLTNQIKVTNRAIQAFVGEASEALGVDVRYRTGSAKTRAGIDDLLDEVAKAAGKSAEERFKAERSSKTVPHSYVHNGSFFRRHPVFGASLAVAASAAILFGLVSASLLSDSMAIGIGCAVAVLAVFVLLVMRFRSAPKSLPPLDSNSPLDVAL